MNPLILLLGLLGTGAAMSFDSSNNNEQSKTDATDKPTYSSGKDKNTKPAPTDTTEEPAPAPAPEEPAPPPAPAPEEPVAEEPAPTPTPEEPVVAGPLPEAPDQTGGSGSDGATTTPLVADGSVDVMAGRVATLEPGADDVVSVKIVSGVANGNITVNPDNTFALVMTQSDFIGTQSFTYEATHADGSTTLHTTQLNVTPGAQDGGWGTGETHYMLATDENDRVIVEHGENHTKVFISGSADALSLADIARMENMSLSDVTGDWLADSKYGQSEEFALDGNAGMMLWNTVTPRGSDTSNWLLFERGYEYDNLGRLLDRDTDGESEINPLYMGAWGTGEAPEIKTEFYQYQESTSNLVVQDLHFSGGVFVTYAENMIFDNVLFTKDEVSFQNSDSITIRNSEFIDIVREESKDGGAWDDHSDRIQGLFMNRLDGALLEGNFFDYIAWDESYLDGDGMPPSMWSHNIYLGDVMTDVTMRDTISMRAASYGAQIRSGGFIEDNLFIDNNAALTFVGGDYKGAGPVGEYTLAADNLVTSAAHKEATYIGALSLGIKDEGALTSLVDNIVAHLADPNSNELDYKYDTRYSVYSEKESYYDDTIVYNWEGSKTVFNPEIITEQNIDGLDTAALDQTTIQLFTAQLLNKPDATIEDLANYLRAQASGALDGVVDADLILRFFQEGFGVAPDIRDEAATLRFIPDDLGEGVRWDNRLNWDTEDLPGLYAADSVDLGGNHVVFGTNAQIDTLDFGPDGALNVYGGRLTVNGGITGDDSGSLNIEGAGQFWTEGSDADDTDITVQGGRFANTGLMQNADLTATGGQTILAAGGAEFDLGAGHTLEIADSDARVGFDGDDGGMAILDMHEGATLAFSAQDGDLGSIEEFRSGAFGDAPDVQSGIDLGDALLEINLSGLSSTAGTAFTLMSADEIVGLFDDATIGGLGARNANIVIDYLNDTVTLQLSSGNGAVSIETVGDETDVSSGAEALWNTLTAGQDVLSETAQAMLPEDDIEDPLLAA